MAHTPKLLPCPFCGSEAEQPVEWGHRNRKAILFHCSNHECIAHQHEQDEQGGYNCEFGSVEEARDAWNRRAPDALARDGGTK